MGRNRLILRYGGDHDVDYVWRDRNRVVIRDGIEMETASKTED